MNPFFTAAEIEFFRRNAEEPTIVNPFFTAAEEAGTVMEIKRKIDWVGTSIQAVCCVAIGFATGWWWALALACIWALINHWKNNGG